MSKKNIYCNHTVMQSKLQRSAYKFIWNFFLIMLIFTFSGCAISSPYLHVEVNSFSLTNSGQNKTFVILSGNEKVSNDDLEFREYSMYLTRALTSIGYTQANSQETADLAIFLTYGISDPKTYVNTYSKPVWGQTGTSSTTTYGTATTIGNSTYLNTSTTQQPTYGITGYRTETETITNYLRYASISGYDFKKYKETGESSQIWSTNIESTGPSGDLRRVFPVMVAAATPYIGKSSGNKTLIRINEQDDHVRKLKGLPIYE